MGKKVSSKLNLFKARKNKQMIKIMMILNKIKMMENNNNNLV